MKLLVMIACLLFVACSTYDGSGKQCEQYGWWANPGQCYKDYSKELEKEIEILKVKLECGCKELKEGK